jgi:leucyl aminopeptidase
VGEIVELLAPAGLSHGRLLLVGTGPTDKIDAGVAERIGGAIAARLLLSGETTVSVDVTGVLTGDLAAHQEPPRDRLQIFSRREPLHGLA